MNKFHTYKIRVRYGETDQMGFVYYGNYALYLEQARTELIRTCGISYKEIEKQNIHLPVTELNIRYSKPAGYDDIITMKTWLTEKPSRTIIFHTEMYNEAQELLNKSTVKLIVLNKETSKITSLPNEIATLIQKFADA